MTTAIDINERPPAEPAHRAAGFTDTIRSEWTKARTVPSTMWILIAAAAVGIGLGALVSGLSAQQYGKASLSARVLWDPTAVSVTALILAQLAAGVLGILVMTSEYSSGAIRTSLLAVPRRGRFFAAKAVVVIGLTFVSGEIMAFAAFFLGQALISGHAPAANLAQPDVLRALVGCGLYLALVGLLGLALGTMLRNSVGAVAVLVGLVTILPSIAGALPSSVGNTIQKFWPTRWCADGRRGPIPPHVIVLGWIRRYVSLCGDHLVGCVLFAAAPRRLTRQQDNSYRVIATGPVICLPGAEARSPDPNQSNSHDLPVDKDAQRCPGPLFGEFQVAAG